MLLCKCFEGKFADAGAQRGTTVVRGQRWEGREDAAGSRQPSARSPQVTGHRSQVASRVVITFTSLMEGCSSQTNWKLLLDERREPSRDGSPQSPHPSRERSSSRDRRAGRVSGRTDEMASDQSLCPQRHKDGGGVGTSSGLGSLLVISVSSRCCSHRRNSDGDSLPASARVRSLIVLRRTRTYMC